MNHVMKLDEVSERLRVAPTTIYSMLKRGELSGFRIGRSWRVNAESLEAWIANAENRSSTTVRGASRE